MDIDAIAKHVPALLAFKARIEKMIEGVETGSGGAAEALDGKIEDVRKEVSDLGEHVSALQVSKDEAESFSERLTTMLDWFEANREAIDILLSIGDDLKTEVTGTGAAAPITLDQLDATTKPQLKEVEVPETLSNAVAPAENEAAAATETETSAN